MRSTLLACIALLPLISAEPIVYLIRHGEKPSSGNGLSAEGEQRAQCLTNVFGPYSKYDIGHIMAETPESGTLHRPLMSKCTTDSRDRRLPPASV